jgi:hypothetical protein
MTSTTDLEFLPLRCRSVDGQIEIDIDEELVLVLDPSQASNRESVTTTVVVRGLVTRSPKDAR